MLRLTALLTALLSLAAQAAGPQQPLDLRLPDGSAVENCADPTVLAGQRPGDPAWTLVCTQDPLHDRDRGADGKLRFRRLPMFTSTDLRHWRYQGEALPALPPQADPAAGVWAPELSFAGGRYLLYYAITDLADAASPEPGCRSDSAIGVAVADSPLGPWTPQPRLVVPPRRSQPSGCHFHWTIDADRVVTPEGRPWLFYGSYDGGLFAQPLDDSGLALQGAPVPIAPGDRFEGPEVVFKDGWYHLFVSASNCCNGELTGYGLYVGRSRDVAGPYLDAEGRPLLAARSGGTPLVVQDGGRWVGPGHNSVVRTADGRWWSVHHAVDRHQGRWTGSTLTRRPAVIAELHWADGWPRLAGAPAPAWTPDTPAALHWVDEFSGDRLDPRWRAVRQAATPLLRDRLLQLPTDAGDLHPGAALAPLWVRPLPDGADLLVRTRVALDVPPEGRLPGFPQAGLAVLGEDDLSYLKLVHVAIQGTRQTEFGIAVPPRPDAPRYGNTLIGPPGDWTDLALHLSRQGQRVTATAWTRADGGAWVRGGTWVHDSLGPRLRVALLAMGGAGHSARFAHLRVSSAPRITTPDD